MSMEGMEDIVKEFLVESHENLDQMDRDLVSLEEKPGDVSILGSIFRTIHTIKGSCGFFGFSKLESITHEGENLLHLAREGKLQLIPARTTALLALVDAIRKILANIEKQGNEGDEAYSKLAQTLKELQVPESSNVPADEPSPSASSASAAPSGNIDRGPASEPLAAPSKSIYERLGGNEAVGYAVTAFYNRVLDDPELRPFFAKVSVQWLKEQQTKFLIKAFGGPDAYQGRSLKDVHSHLHIEPRHFDRVVKHLRGSLEFLGVDRALVDEILNLIAPLSSQIITGPAVVEPAAPIAGRISASEPETRRDEMSDVKTEPKDTTESQAGNVTDSNIRVDVNLLDRLMNLVGELVLARNQILQFTSNQKDTALTGTSQRLNLITTELQEGVMKTRMQPIGNVWNRMPRVVRDLAVACGKQVRVDMEGKETELDKTLIEAIKDPLVHIIRNAIDHGIESSEFRVKAGKEPEGRLLLRAFHEGGQVNIEISDDGAGVQYEKIREKALQKNLINPEQAARMTERELLNLIFLPGFSTAEKVTNISGRGVGMDVVKTNIEKIGGTIDIQSVVGKGSVFKIKIPLTLAIIPALIVTTGGDRYAIPQVSLLELVRLNGEESESGIETIHGAPVYRLRGNLLPLIYLNRELKLPEAPLLAGGGAVGYTSTNIVVLQANNRPFGLVVDQINDTQEIVVKPLGKQLKGVTAFAGATIMGDGNVALILDVFGLAQKSGVIAEAMDRALNEKSSDSRESNQDRQSILLFRVGSDGRMAMPLSSVSRLEEFDESAVEKAGNREVIQYRNQIMPLVRLSQLLGRPALPGAGRTAKIQVVVSSIKGQNIGLIVEDIVDIVDESVSVENRFHDRGIAGSAVVQKKVTDLLNVEDVFNALHAAPSEKEVRVA